MPNIRYVCKKVGINHSTFYRWMDKHFDFLKEVEYALAIGRRNINDAAEAVIISGIQNQDFKASTFWLKHNTGRYSTSTLMHDRLARIEEKQQALMSEKTPPDSVFESLFKKHYALQKILGEQKARDHFAPVLDLYNFADPNLKEIFYSAYKEWIERQKHVVGASEELIEADSALSKDILDLSNQSVIHDDYGEYDESDSGSADDTDREG